MRTFISHFFLFLMLFHTAPVLSFGRHVTSRDPYFPVHTDIISDQKLSDKDPLSTESISLPVPRLEVMAKPSKNTESSDAQVMLPAASGGGSNVESFTGDFSYSIPVMDVEGFPLVLSYNSNVGMMQEASWVGLGWNLDLGSISREVRGIPDDFNGTDVVMRTYKMKTDATDGYKAGGYAGVVKKKSQFQAGLQVTALWGRYTSSYLGLGKTFDFGLAASLNIPFGKNDQGLFGLNQSLGYSSDSKQGTGVNKSTGINLGFGPGKEDKGIGGGIGASFGGTRTSRHGLQSAQLGLTADGGYENNRDNSDVAHVTNMKGYSATSSITFGTRTSMPRASLNTVSTSNMFSVNTYVAKKLPNDWSARLGLIYQDFNSESVVQLNSDNTFAQPAYGYLHSGKRASSSTTPTVLPVMDYERGLDHEYSTAMKNLPFSVATYDIFHVNSPVFGGVFRAGRSDVGTYFDPATWATLNDGSELLVDDDIKAIIAGYVIPRTIDIGYSTGISQAESRYEVWDGSLAFTTQPNGPNFDATTYFKGVGECTPNPDYLFNLIGGTAAKAVGVASNQSQKKILSNGIMGGVGSVNSSTFNTLPNTPVRATSFRPYTNSELQTIDDIALRTPLVYSSNLAPGYMNRTGNANHIGAIVVTDPSGVRVAYDLPVYTLIQSESVFSVTGHSISDEVLTNYDHGTDNSTNNARGRAQFYDKTSVPGHVSSYLLTRVLSPDYVDIGQDGPSIDDVGSYHKLDYVKYSSPGKSRLPYVANPANNVSKAFVSRGYTATDIDDLGQFSYSETEVYYPLSVEGKNMIAVFELEDREDAHYSQSDAGGIGMAKKLLKRIRLYNRADYRLNGSAATVLQVVEFSYSYELCPNTPMGTQNGQGKLTLTGIKFYSGQAKQTSFSEYKFDYSDVNPAFSYANVDGWGNYKLSNSSSPNYLNPSADQNPVHAQESAEAWRLVHIEQPGGGLMDITYEADSYSYVQSSRAMKLSQLSGMLTLHDLLEIKANSTWDVASLSSDFNTNGLIPTSAGTVYQTLREPYGTVSRNIPNLVMVFRLPGSITGSLSISDAQTRVENELFQDANGTLVQEYFFKLYAKIKSDEEDYEMIPIFGKALPEDRCESIGLDYALGVLPPCSGSADYQYGYIVLEPHNSELTVTAATENSPAGIMRHPFQSFCIDYARVNLPDKVYGSCAGCDPNTSLDNKSFFSTEFYNTFINQDYLKTLDLNNSTVRLHTDKKFGGGARVKSIAVSDNWQSISSENLTYLSDVEYDYAQGKSVNAAEPRGLDDESPLYSWSTYKNIIREFPDEAQFHVRPISAQLMPQAQVGYERVRSQTLNGSRGWSESRYYTAYDMPWQNSETLIDKKDVVKRNIVTGASTELYGFSQGYSVVTNDFHGKLRESRTMDAQGNVISSTKLEYYTPGEQIQMIDRKGNVSLESVSREFDVHADSRFAESNSKYLMLGLIISWTLPVQFGFTPQYGTSSTKSGFYSNTFIKHTNYSAVVKGVSTNYLGSENYAKNLLYDYYSGSPVLTSLRDEYDDELYSFNYPSHWAYGELREKERSSWANVQGSCGGSSFTTTDINGFSSNYSTGDRVELHVGGTTYSGVITSIAYNGTSYNVVLSQPSGSQFTLPMSSSAELQMVASNRSNRLNETMASAVSKKELTMQPGTTFSFPTQEILGASAIDYRHKGSISCPYKKEGEPLTLNLFSSGARGKLYLNAEYSWQSERKSTHDHGTRFNGEYLSYTPFYVLDNNLIWNPLSNLANWRPGVRNARYDLQGNVAEVLDPIGISAAVLYGYGKGNGLIPIATADNAKRQDIAFDSFEDYYVNSNPLYEDHFSFKSLMTSGSGISVSQTTRHSGLSSLSVAAGKTATKIVEHRGCEEPPADFQTISDCACSAPFDPSAGSYLLSVWVKQSSGAVIKLISNGVTSTASASTPVIEGWQKFEAVFQVNGTSDFSVVLQNMGTGTVYFDDIRIHPYLSNMSTTVYDPKTFVPMATHDSENFTTFYNYDENLVPTGVKVETIEGIKSVSESSSNIHR